MNKNEMKNNVELTMKKESNKDEMISDAHRLMTICCANRDGDFCYIECPVCHSVDLKPKRFLMCRECGEHFSIYWEDGFFSFNVKQFGRKFLGNDEKVKIIKLEENDLNWYVPFSRHKIEEMDPSEIKTLYKDLHDGKDAHGHEKYRRYALIPID